MRRALAPMDLQLKPEVLARYGLPAIGYPIPEWA